MKTMFAAFAIVLGSSGVEAKFGKDISGFYWVVESNAYKQDTSLVRIYNREHELVSQTKTSYLDVRDRRSVRKLNRILRTNAGK